MNFSFGRSLLKNYEQFLDQDDFGSFIIMMHVPYLYRVISAGTSKLARDRDAADYSNQA